MKTREQLKAEYESELLKLETEERVRAALPGGIEPEMIHTSELYGRRGTVIYGASFSGYGNEKQVSLEQLAELLKALPPLPTVHAEGTYTRFLTEAFADSDQNKEKGKEELALIFPVMLVTNSVSGYSLKAEWFTTLAGQTWEIEAYLAKAWELVRVESRRREHMGGHRYISSETHAHVNEALNPPGGGYWSKVKWAAGSEEWPPHFTLYHGQYDDPPVEWVRRTIENLKSSKKFERAL